ncbi:hypothetical protein TWF696_007868 [Orbilia brochopaga]|uniref:Asl1-like glycosyl hydrolase catalytic domain-containing protein n=1 Tax=Orbilia brochopaga TaxID=3140254 RepID=A0AAV9USL5_9PEZI
MKIQLQALGFILAIATLVAAAANPIGPNPNPKRGLVYCPSKLYPNDDQNWIQPESPLTWYYNYGGKPSTALEGGATELQFVPMLWGNYKNTFIADVKNAIAQGYNITHVLGFNEPDIKGNGGSNITPDAAAARWKTDIQPLAELGIKLGAPAVSGAQAGVTWLKSFFAACNDCTFDFIPLHWYGNFDGLASRIGQFTKTFRNQSQSFWLTEVAYSHQNVPATQKYFNLTMDYLDRLPTIERYTWYGTIRSNHSSIGPNATLLNEEGGLTYIGAWYLNKNQSQAASVAGDPTEH